MTTSGTANDGNVSWSLPKHSSDRIWFSLVTYGATIFCLHVLGAGVCQHYTLLMLGFRQKYCVQHIILDMIIYKSHTWAFNLSTGIFNIKWFLNDFIQTPLSFKWLGWGGVWICMIMNVGFVVLEFLTFKLHFGKYKYITICIILGISFGLAFVSGSHIAVTQTVCIFYGLCYTKSMWHI